MDFIRNTPLIVQLFFIAFGLPAALGYTWPFWAHALLALTINFLVILQKFFEVVCIHTRWPAGGRKKIEPIEENDIQAYRPTTNRCHDVSIVE